MCSRCHHHATVRKSTITFLPHSWLANIGVLFSDSFRPATSTSICASLSESRSSLFRTLRLCCLAFRRRSAFFSRRSITSLSSPSYCIWLASLSLSVKFQLSLVVVSTIHDTITTHRRANNFNNSAWYSTSASSCSQNFESVIHVTVPFLSVTAIFTPSSSLFN